MLDTLQEILFLIFFPLVVAFIMLFLKHGIVRKIIVYFSSAAIIADAVLMAAQHFFSEQNQFLVRNSEIADKVMMIVEIIITLYIIFIGIKHRKYYVSLLSIIQSGLMLWLEFSGRMSNAGASNHIYLDKLSIIMEIIIAVVGGLIAVYSLGYMKVYHERHKEFKDRRKFFFAMIFIFFSAMFGLVFSNNLVWIYFFWEITTLCSFLLIGYTRTEEATNNAFRALWMNLLGGLGFAGAIAYSVISLGTVDLNRLVDIGSKGSAALLPVILISFAGLTKSAQMPFSRWLLGAMVAPTPVSALLHSATMVKAGVYILIRLSPALGNNVAGYMVSIVGGFTFVVTSMIAISQSDAKKVLAYSTISNLGLIAACAGIGMYESVWAGVFLIIFHAVSKSLMFLTVGATENSMGSRNIEDMHGLIIKLPQLAFLMIIGIAGMFLAPFGMLISKWAALKAFIDSKDLILVIFLCFGSAATLFYWTKWIGKLVAIVSPSERLKSDVRKSQWISLDTLAALMVGLCLLFPVISKYLIQPFLSDMYHQVVPVIIGQGNMNIMVLMLCMIAIIPVCVRVLAFNKHNRTVSAYMSGVNAGDNRNFIDSFGEKKKMQLSNWYLESYFGEKRLFFPSSVVAAMTIASMIAIVVGSVLK